jgi:PAS domain S-box-containing protein
MAINTNRILIFDDDVELGQLLKEYLLNTGQCEVIAITELEHFWSSTQHDQFDILFLDYKMPQTNGLEVLQEMGKRGISIPTVMMTGEGNENIAAKAIQSGALDYLVKGEYSFNVLPQLVQKAVRLREMQAAMQQYLDQIRYQAAVLDNMRDAVVVWDLEGRITYWNPAAEQLYGWTAAQRLGMLVTEVYFPFFDPAFDLAALAHEGKVQPEHVYQHPDGALIWVSNQVNPLTKESNQQASNPFQPFGFVDVGRDITRRKEMEDQLQAAQNHLTQAARLASIGELASGVAHQISNPLTTIIGDAQILLHQLGSKHSGRESAEAILKAGWRAQHVINELMQFSQPSHNLHEPVSVNTTIENALLLTNAYIQAIGVKLNIELAPDLPEITANPRQLSDLWVNLLLLARSAVNDGVRHTIRVRSRKIKDSLVVVDVTDDGKPIPREQYATIFEPQLVPSGSGRGTGLELSICREIVRQNHGKISLSGSGNETIFRVTFSSEGPL